MSDTKSLEEKIEELKQQERQAFQVYFTTLGKLKAFEEALSMVYDGLDDEKADANLAKKKQFFEIKRGNYGEIAKQHC